MHLAVLPGGLFWNLMPSDPCHECSFKGNTASFGVDNATTYAFLLWSLCSLSDSSFRRVALEVLWNNRTLDSLAYPVVVSGRRVSESPLFLKVFVRIRDHFGFVIDIAVDGLILA